MKLNVNKISGFSILEIVITLFILVVILALYQVALSSVLLSRNAKDQETALRIANNKLENLRALGYSSLPAGGGFTDTQLKYLPTGSASLAVSNYSASVKQVSVTVYWQEPGAKTQHSVLLTTLIANNGGL